jgi:hypothetical protein
MSCLHILTAYKQHQALESLFGFLRKSATSIENGSYRLDWTIWIVTCKHVAILKAGNPLTSHAAISCSKEFVSWQPCRMAPKNKHRIQTRRKLNFISFISLKPVRKMYDREFLFKIILHSLIYSVNKRQSSLSPRHRAEFTRGAAGAG